MPKSASLMVQLGGDERVLDAQASAVKSVMGFLEKNFAEARDYSRGSSGEAVKTGNLVYALFQHDTSRKLDPRSRAAFVTALGLSRDGGSLREFVGLLADLVVRVTKPARTVWPADVREFERSGQPVE